MGFGDEKLPEINGILSYFTDFRRFSDPKGIRRNRTLRSLEVPLYLNDSISDADDSIINHFKYR